MNMSSISHRALDSKEICRFCLSEDVRLVSIFKEEDLRYDDERLAVAARVMSISPVEIHEGDGLPELACLKCIQLLDQACHFRDQVERSDAVLRHHYGRLWPETNPQLQKLLKEDQVVKKNLNADFPSNQNESTEASCVVTLRQEDVELNDGSQSPNFDDDYDEPQDYSMDCDDDGKCKIEPEDLTERGRNVTTPDGYMDINSLDFEEQLEPISLALRETQNKSAPKVQPSLLTIPNISVSLIQKNNIAREAQAQAQAQAQSQSKSRRWRKTNEPCTICGKCFKDRFAMKVHLRTHSGEKPFVCQVCGKAFRQKAHLGKHSYTHSALRKQQVPQSQAAALPVVLQPQQTSPQNQASNQPLLNAPPSVTSPSYLNPADVKAKLARLKTSLQTKSAPKADLQPITVPVPVFPRLQKQGLQCSGGSPPRSETPPSDGSSSPSPPHKSQTEPLALVPKTLSPSIIPKVGQPLMLTKPMLTVPQITPKSPLVSSTVPSSVALYVMANGLLPPNVVVGNGHGLKKS